MTMKKARRGRSRRYDAIAATAYEEGILLAVQVAASWARDPVTEKVRNEQLASFAVYMCQPWAERYARGCAEDWRQSTMSTDLQINRDWFRRRTRFDFDDLPGSFGLEGRV